jgi:ergothioneine biosynthesis protein EgtB
MEPGFAPFHPQFRFLFNSYYNGIGARHPRPQRGLLTRPALAEVLAYRRQVDERMAALLATRADDAELARLVILGLHHEQQHQELILTDLKHLFAQSILAPAYTAAPLPAATPVPAMDWLAFEGGVATIGHAGEGFAFDNELPRHRQFVEPFALATRLVTNGEYLAFIEAGGYRNPALWLAEGWDAVNSASLAHPLYWRRGEGGRWCEFTLHGLQPLDPHRPVTHVSLFEADAYAHWADARLPAEGEWELACHASGAQPESHWTCHPQGVPAVAGTALGAATPSHARAAPALSTSAGQGGAHSSEPSAVGARLLQMFGACWQWTSSSYAPYPGFRAAAGAVGEYNGKFMVNQYVLRGSSCVTPPGHARASYRNFFPAGARWQFTGIRLAR